MRVRFWGVRGSIPVSGKAYERFGGDTSCIEILGSGSRSLIIDAGTGLRGLGNHLAASEPGDIHLLLTHFHWDHILGLPFFRPLYDSRFSITIHGPTEPELIEEALSVLMRQPHFPVPWERIRARLSFVRVPLSGTDIAGFAITAIPLRHPSPGLGYGLEDESGRFVFLTDNELDTEHDPLMEAYVDFAGKADLLVHDAEYTETEYAMRRGWGHSSADRALGLAISAGVKRFALYHHNQDRPDAEVEAMAEQCRQAAIRAGSRLDCFAAAQGQEVEF